MRINDRLVQVTDPDSVKSVLSRKLFDINIKLFHKNPAYRVAILAVITTMLDALKTKYDDYNTLKGISGANVGLPFNIIIVCDKDCETIMVNPKICDHSDEKKTVNSNCGSICLDKPIKVERYKWIEVSFFRFKKNTRNKLEHVNHKFYNGATCSTIQHEIDHNNGILITDKQKF